MEAVVPGLLVDGEAPARGRARLLHRVVVALRAVGLDGVAVQQVGVGDAGEPWTSARSSMPPELGPALLGDGHRPALELEDEDRVVLAAGLVAVDEGAHLGVDGLDGRAGRASSGRTRWRGSPCPWSRRRRSGPRPRSAGRAGPSCFSDCLTSVGLPRAPSSSSCFRRTYLGAKHSSSAYMSLTSALRQAAIMRSASARFRQSGFSITTCLPAAAASSVTAAVQVVGDAQHHHVHLGQGQELPVVGEVPRDAVPLRRSPGRAPGVGEATARISAWCRRARPRHGCEVMNCEPIRPTPTGRRPAGRSGVTRSSLPRSRRNRRFAASGS